MYEASNAKCSTWKYASVQLWPSGPEKKPETTHLNYSDEMVLRLFENNPRLDNRGRFRKLCSHLIMQQYSKKTHETSWGAGKVYIYKDPSRVNGFRG